MALPTKLRTKDRGNHSKDVYKRQVFKSIEQVIAYKHDNIVGRFSCKGFDTFGPFKLIGGVSKGPVSYTHLDVYKRQGYDDIYMNGDYDYDRYDSDDDYAAGVDDAMDEDYEEW